MARILVVEDDPDILGLVRYHLGKAGHRVIATESGEAALEILDEKEPPDIAVLDVGLPGISGRDLALRIRTDDRTSAVRIVFLTASIDPEDIEAAKEISDAYLTKPFIASALIATVQRLSQVDIETEGW